MKKLFLATFIALFFSVNFVNGQAAVNNFTQDFNSCFYNCNNAEYVCVTGTIHVVLKNNGNYHFNVHATGTGSDSGAPYVLNYIENYMPDANQGTWSANIKLNGQGSVPDLRAKLIAHYTINANGEVVVDFFKVTDNCD